MSINVHWQTCNIGLFRGVWSSRCFSVYDIFDHTWPPSCNHLFVLQFKDILLHHDDACIVEGYKVKGIGCICKGVKKYEPPQALQVKQTKQAIIASNHCLPGDLVRVGRLKTDSGQALNGQEGKILRYLHEVSRYEVRFESTDSTRALKPESLQKIEAAQGPPAKGRARA